MYLLFVQSLSPPFNLLRFCTHRKRSTSTLVRYFLSNVCKVLVLIMILVLYGAEEAAELRDIHLNCTSSYVSLHTNDTFAH